ncbi:MAG: class I SAM-dependent methyltransferase [Patescibacteria group bacterium]
MENIINEKPATELHGRTLFNTIFVDDSDIKNKTVLDVGCGYGWFELSAVKRGCSKIIGIEISGEDLKTAKENIDNDRIEFKTGSAIQLPFNDNEFDSIVSWEVIEHIPKNTENIMFREVKRVLKNNGVFYLSTPYNNFFSNIFDPAWWLIGHRHYKKNDLIKFAENNGFKIEKIVLNGGWWEILGINNLYIAKWIFRRAPFFEDLFNKKQDEEYRQEKGFTNIFIKFRKKYHE